MDSQSLHTASHYINNLLLSRGLLKNGAPIAFAKPSRCEGGSEATMAKIINLVHEMVLRRDRETEQRENLAMTIHALRSNETKQTLELERLRTRIADADRQLSIAQGQERAFTSTLRATERSARGLREEMLRLKTMLHQVRGQCANDLHKRDVQIQRLKSHLTTQQRGVKPPSTNTTITITPGSQSTVMGRETGGVPLDSPNYSLSQETTEFLTRLSQNLSDENDHLIGLVRSTLTTLRSVQGLSAAAGHTKHALTGEDGNGERTEDMSASDQTDDHLVQVLPTSYDTLAHEMDDVLEHLRTLLSNPSFVPLEEVEVREDEILRLREGWEKMEGRWREAVRMMDGWRKRMASGGKAVNLDELRLGLSLSPVKVAGVLDVVEEEGSSMAEVDMQAVQDAVEAEQEDATDEDEQSQNAEGYIEEALGVGLQPDGRVLGEINGNVQTSGASRDETDNDVFREVADDGSSADEVALLPTSDPKPAHMQAPPSRALGRSQESKIPRQTQKRSLPADADADRPAKLSTATIQRKLNRAKVEAEQAAKREAEARRRRERMGARPKPPSGVKRDKVAKQIKSRRRSTLTTEELESLMMGNREGGED